MQPSEHSVIEEFPNDVKKLDLASIFRPSMFWTPDRQDPTALAWVEHVPFAFWIVDVLRPKRIVELGTHTGISYSALCQAVKTLCLNTSCFAVDTWQGDEYSGAYGDDVYRDFAAFHDPRYGTFSQLVRSTFDDAIDHFDDHSIDLLHIAGLQSYDTVRHIYESWLRKLSQGAILILHDTNARERHFGVSRLWNEISAAKSHFNFLHGHGLGVLGMGCDYPGPLGVLFHARDNDYLLNTILQTFGTLGRAVRLLCEGSKLRTTLREQVNEIEVLRRRLLDRTDQISALAHEVGSLQGALSERANDISRRQAALFGLANEIRRLESALSERKTEVFSLRQQLTAREVDIARLRSSTSWRATAPLRAVTTRLRTISRWPVPYPPVLGDPTGQPTYEQWIQKNDSITDTDRKRIRKHIASFNASPLLSIIMPVYNTTPDFLVEAVDSILHQLYPNWELCIADDASTLPQIRTLLASYAQRDARIKVTFRDTNGGISECTNTALAAASGDWIVLVDHDDVISEHALYLVAEAINRRPDLAIIYSDEDHIDERGQRGGPYFKPDWDYDLFLGQNLISHLGAYRTEFARAVGGFRQGFDGSQDWDFALRVLEAAGGAGVYHIPFVLYHWRDNSKSFSHTSLARAADSAVRAIAQHLERTGQRAEATLLGASSWISVRRALPATPPLVSIIIPTKDRRSLLETCIDGLINRTNYAGLEIVIVDNGSTEHDACDFLTDLQSRDGFVVLDDQGDFNFSRLVNRGVRASTGDICVLLNNDINVINDDWLIEMTTHALRPDVGAVGAKLYFHNDTLQHGGVTLGVGGIAAHQHRYEPRTSLGYVGRLRLAHASSCVTGACLATRRLVYDEVGGFDEKNLPIAYNDVDFCIRLRKAGYRIIWTPGAELYHYESASRGSDLSAEKARALADATEYMKRRWSDILVRDPYYNPNLSLDSDHFDFASQARVARPWLCA